MQSVSKDYATVAYKNQSLEEIYQRPGQILDYDRGSSPTVSRHKINLTGFNKIFECNRQALPRIYSEITTS